MRSHLTRWVLIAAMLASTTWLTGAAPHSVFASQPTLASHAAPVSLIPNAFGWRDELVDKLGDVGYASSIALDSAGYPHVAYYDFTNHALKYAAWDGVAWALDTVESDLGASTGALALRSSLAVFGTTTYIAYEKSDDQTGVRYVRLAAGGIGGWNLSTVSPLTANTFAYAPALRLDSHHNLHLSYTLRDRLTQFSAQQIIYARLDTAATQWQLQTVDNCDCWDWYDGVTSTLALDTHDRPHIAYAGTYNGPFKYASFNGTSWQTQSVDADSHFPSLAVDTAGFPHVAYLKQPAAPASATLQYSSWNGSAWQITTVSNCQCNSSPSLALDVFDQPRITLWVAHALFFVQWDGATWRSSQATGADVDPGEPALALDVHGNAHISYFDGGFQDLHTVSWASNWQTQTVALAGDEAHLAIDLHNRPYISYSTNPLPAYYHVQLANWTPGGDWHYREALPFPAGDHAMRLVYDLNRQPLPIFSFVDLEDQSHPHLGFAQWNGATFVTQTVDSRDGTGFDSSLAFDGQANPVVGYMDLNSGHPLLKYAASTNSGLTWNIHMDTAAPTLGINSGLRSLSAGGSPVSGDSYIAYYEAASQTLRLATYDGAQWTDELVDSANSGPAGSFVSLAVDRTTGKPAMGYLAGGDVRYAFWRGAWLTETVDSGVGTVGDLSLSLALFSDQYPRIAYTARADKSLRLAWTTALTSSAWTIETAATFNTDPTATFPIMRVSSQVQERDHLAFSAPSTGVVYAFRSATLPYSLYFNPLQPCPETRANFAAYGQALTRVRALAPMDLTQVDDLTTLRALRDLFALSPGGRYYINLYYQHAPEAGALALANPTLLWDAYRTLENFLPGFQALAAGQGNRQVITQAMVDQVNSIADRLMAVGSPALGGAINLERGKFNHLQALVGQTFDGGAKLLGVASYAVYLPITRR